MQRWRRRSLDTKYNADEKVLLSKKLEFAAHPRNLALIHDALDQFEVDAINMKGAAVATIYDAFRTATIEVSTNILRHAYSPDDLTAPLTFQLYLFGQRVEAVFYDQGIAFKAPAEIGPPMLDELADIAGLPEGNLGLFLALQALDRLDYSRTPDGVNLWRLIKFLA